MKKEDIISTLEEQKPTAEITDRTRRIPQTQPIFFHIPFGEINGDMEHTTKIENIIQWLF